MDLTRIYKVSAQAGACIPYRQSLLFKHDNIFNKKIDIILVQKYFSAIK
jgi:hypothetical protein